jgi:hypothetical protein
MSLRCLALVFSLAWSLTACIGIPVGDVAHQTLSSLGFSPGRASNAGPLAGDSGYRSGNPVLLRAPSPVLIVLPASDFFGSSTLRLSKNEDGSISALSDGRSVSLLRELDPALVNPAVRPFLLPSCDVPPLASDA